MIDSASTGLPLLSLLVITLPVGAALIWLVPYARAARWITLGTALVDLVLAMALLAGFDSSAAGFQFVEKADWIPTLHIHYAMGVDGISILFLPLTVALFIGVILSSWNSIKSMPRLYYTLLLLLESATLGVFCALDTALFFMFWELTLIPLYFLISLWGLGPNRRYAGTKYTLFMLVSGTPLLFGFLVLAFNHADINGLAIPAGLNFDYLTLLHTPVSGQLQMIVFLLLLLGFAAKIPVFPLHTWLPVVGMEGPAAVAALMTGLKLGAYGLIRYAVPLAPQAAQELHWLLAGLGVIGILYGALGAMAQSNIRRMLAYASMSHVGMVVLGISAFSLQGLQGAVFQLLNFTLIAGGLFLLAGLLHLRTGSTDLISLGGVARTMPLLAAFFFFLGLASMGVPATSGFPAEFLILISALNSHTGAGLAALFGLVVGAGYFLRMYRLAFLGPVSNDVIKDASDLNAREILMVMTFSLIILFAGLYPSAMLDLTRAAGEGWVAHLSR